MLVAHHEVPGRLGRPVAGRVLGHAGEVHPAGVDFDEEQHVVATQRDGVDGEEVTREDPGCLGAQELCPGLRRPARRRIDARLLEDRPHGRGGDGDAEPGEFAVDASGTPGRVLPSETDDRPSGFVDGRPGRWG
jgi:hypothetical protein